MVGLYERITNYTDSHRTRTLGRRKHRADANILTHITVSLYGNPVVAYNMKYNVQNVGVDEASARPLRINVPR